MEIIIEDRMTEEEERLYPLPAGHRRRLTDRSDNHALMLYHCCVSPFKAQRNESDITRNSCTWQQNNGWAALSTHFTGLRSGVLPIRNISQSIPSTTQRPP